jgi:hypothetical protein
MSCSSNRAITSCSAAQYLSKAIGGANNSNNNINLKAERRYFMARKKRTSAAFEKLALRLSGLKTIDEKLDLGDGLSVATLTLKVATCTGTLEDYNILLGKADSKLNEVDTLEIEANDLSERILISVAAKYGKNSNEYQKTGGKRKSDIKRNTPRKQKDKKNNKPSNLNEE